MITNRVIGGNGGKTASIFVTGLSETDTVTAAKDGKSYSGKWVSRPNPACVVPDGYNQLEYIESSGTQYINTGIRLESNYVIDMDISINSGNSDRWIFGADNYSDNRYGVNSLDDTSIQAIFCANSWTPSTSITVGERFNIEYKLGSQQTCSKDGAVFGTKTNTINKSSLDLYIFSDNINNTVTSPSKIRAYTFKCYSDLEKSTIIMNLVPCKRSSDNAIGMYDLVTNTFYGNSGTGTFVAGAEVQQIIDGFLIDNIKSYGTYTITATDGTNTSTQDVLVDMAIQFDVEMSYFNGLKLYWYGDECEDVTGGWSQTFDYGPNSGSFVKNSDNIQLNTVVYSNMNMGSSKKISRGSYTKLCIELSQTSARASKSMFGYGPTNYRTEDDDNAGRCNYDDSVPPLPLTAYNREVFSLDLTLDEFYVWFGSNYASGAMTHNFYKVWLE